MLRSIEFSESTLSARLFRARRLALILVGVLGVGLGSAQGQEQLRSSLFGEVEQLIEVAADVQAAFLSPKSHAAALAHYEKSIQEFNHGQDSKKIEKRLTEVKAELARAIENARLARLTLKNALAAREDAVAAGAREHAPDSHQRAERRLRAAIDQIEDGDIRDAKSKGAEAEKLYRLGELEAIKTSILGRLETLLKHAASIGAPKYAPRSHKLAVDLAARAEKLLTADRYAQAEARRVADQAEYEARHAIYLCRLTQSLMSNPSALEDTVLQRETEWRKIAQALGTTVEFKTGFSGAVRKVEASIAALNEKLRRRGEELARLENRAQERENQNRDLRRELDELRAQGAGLAAQLELEHRKEQKLRTVSAMFEPTEAEVIRQGDKLILRLRALTFPVGQAVIESSGFALLTKVQRAIREFPNSSIIVEGHTDARGDNQANQRLSEARAGAVKQYLQANMGLPADRIKAVGYGEVRPIRSNDSAAGRAQNRRIDVVLDLNDAS